MSIHSIAHLCITRPNGQVFYKTTNPIITTGATVLLTSSVAVCGIVSLWIASLPFVGAYKAVKMLF